MYTLSCNRAYVGLLGSFEVGHNVMCRDALNQMLQCHELLNCMLARREKLKCMLDTINHTECIQNAWRNFTSEFSTQKPRES